MFQGVALVLGIPSLILFAYLAWGAIQLHMVAPPKAISQSPVGNPIIDLLTAAAALFVKSVSLVGSAAEWAIRIAAVALFLLTAVAAVLFAIARGLHAGRAWARILGIVVALAPLMSSILIVTSFRRPLPMAIGTAGAILAGYAIWVLGWRFA